MICGDPKKTGTRKTPIDVLSWKGKSQGAPPIHNNLRKPMIAERENHYSEVEHLNGYPTSSD